MAIGERDSVLNSSLAVDVMERIASGEEGDYGSSIAESLGKSQASIGRVIGELEDLGFLEKGVRKRAQYYTVDYEFIGGYWYNTIRNAVENLEHDSKRRKWPEKGTMTRESVLDGMEAHEEKIQESVSDYVMKLLEGGANLEGITLSELIYESYAYSIGHNIIEDPGFLEGRPHLEYSKDAMIFTLNVLGYPSQLREMVSGRKE